jgi:hypothetical protein
MIITFQPADTETLKYVGDLDTISLVYNDEITFASGTKARSMWGIIEITRETTT